jgi:hypothetical protein|tara:strand:- start:256 stop:1125 length:870 start_codon:yes stop_codon:yes gene_type:complete
MKKRIIILIASILLLGLIAFVSAEEIVPVHGMAINQLGQQMEGVSVSFKGGESSSTDKEGKYSVNLPISEDSIYLEFSKNGYRSTSLVFHKEDDKFIVEDKSFDRCFPYCDNPSCQNDPILKDAKPRVLEFENKNEILEDEINVYLYPFSNIYVYWNEPIITEVAYTLKRCPDFESVHAGNSQLKKDHILGMALPLSYDAQLILTTEGNKKETIPISNNEFGKHVKVYKEKGEIITQVCEGESCNPPEKSFFGKYFIYIFIGSLLLIILLTLIIFLTRKKRKTLSDFGQ